MSIRFPRVHRRDGTRLFSALLIASVLLAIVGSSRADAAAGGSAASAGPLSGPDAARGPLVVSRKNPRYFTTGSVNNRKMVYLTGSHIWNNLHDGLGPGFDCSETAEQNDYSAYLSFLEERGHNFIRLWRWEHFKSQAAGGAFHLCMSPQPWARTGGGTASDGKPKFDLSKFDQAYFDRLRERVIAAGNKGIYASVMFFEGFCLKHCLAPDNIAGHPFQADNNVNGVNITSIKDYQVLPIDPALQRLQKRYIRKVMDTVQDIPNVLYEVVNESSGNPDHPTWGDSTQWQYWVIDYIKKYQDKKGYQRHPIGMTMQYPVRDQSKVNEPLLNSEADWISPGFEVENPTLTPPDRWFLDPPANDGTKVIISDTDHYAPGLGEPLWAWKTFVRGHHPILMDFGIIDVVNPLDPSTGVPPFSFYESTRFAMGDTLDWARRMDLARMVPRGDLTSTGFALADPGDEYLVLQPTAGTDPFTVTLPAGTYAATWFTVNTREMKAGGKLKVKSPGAISFTAPIADEPVVLHLERGGSPIQP